MTHDARTHEHKIPPTVCRKPNPNGCHAYIPLQKSHPHTPSEAPPPTSGQPMVPTKPATQCFSSHLTCIQPQPSYCSVRLSPGCSSSACRHWHCVTTDGAGCTDALSLATETALCALYRRFSFHHLPHCAVLYPKALLWVNDFWSAIYHISIIALLMASPAPSYWLGSYSIQPTKVDLTYMSTSLNPLRHSSRTLKPWRRK
jgi:hypothetical protein